MAANFYPATGLALGQVGDLNTIDGVDLLDGDGAIVITDESVYIYTLVETSGDSENSPSVIAPSLNAGDKRWILVNTFDVLGGAMKSLVYANLPGAF